MEMRSGYSEMFVITQVSTVAIEECPLSGVPLYIYVMLSFVRIVQLSLPFKRYIYPCDQDIVSFRCNSIGEVQHLTANVTMREMNLESQSVLNFNYGHGDGEQVSSHQGVVRMNGRVVTVLQNYSVISETGRIFQYHSDIMLKYSFKSVIKAVINCSSGVNYDVKELSLSCELY